MKKQELKEAMSTIFDSLLADSTREAISDPLFDFIASNREWLGDPEDLDTMLNYRYKNIIGECVKLVYGINDHVINLIYTNWGFFDNNVTSLTQQLEGSGCSADRGRTIVKSYIDYKISGELPAWGDHYGYPRKGTPRQWMDFIEGIAHLYLGRPEKYLSAYKELLSNSEVK